MAAATDSTSAPIIPFPAPYVRPTDPLGRKIDDWTRAKCAANAVLVFGSGPEQAVDVVRSLIVEGGFNPIAHVLEENAFAIGMLQGAVTKLVAADAMIAEAADRVLAEVGL